MNVDFSYLKHLRSLGRKYYGKKGEDVLVIGSISTFPIIEDAVDNEEVVISLFGYDNHIQNIINNTDKSKIVYIDTSGKGLVTNNFYLSRFLYSLFPSEYEDFKNNLITLLDSLLLYNKPEKFIVIMGYHSPHIKDVIKILRNIYLETNYSSTCILCSREIGFSYSRELQVFFNIPVCSHHYLDYYKIAIDYRNNEFDINNIHNYTGKYNLECIKCGRHYSGYSPYCRDCYSPYEYVMDLALNKQEPEKRKIVKEEIKIYHCIDCGQPIDREGLCGYCEENYDWDRIDYDIDEGNLSWYDFVNDPNVRECYRI